MQKKINVCIGGATCTDLVLRVESLFFKDFKASSIFIKGFNLRYKIGTSVKGNFDILTYVEKVKIQIHNEKIKTASRVLNIGDLILLRKSTGDYLFDEVSEIHCNAGVVKENNYFSYSLLYNKNLTSDYEMLICLNKLIHYKVAEPIEEGLLVFELVIKIEKEGVLEEFSESQEVFNILSVEKLIFNKLVDIARLDFNQGEHSELIVNTLWLYSRLESVRESSRRWSYALADELLNKLKTDLNIL